MSTLVEDLKEQAISDGITVDDHGNIPTSELLLWLRKERATLLNERMLNTSYKPYKEDLLFGVFRKYAISSGVLSEIELLQLEILALQNL